MIIPAYNAARTVDVAVESVLSQTFDDFELIVVDDGSADATGDIVRGLRDPRVRCVTTSNGGVARARNHGLGLSSGEFVAFLDADDAWWTTKLERQLEVMTEASVGLCFTAAELVDDQLRLIEVDPVRQYADYSEALLNIGNVLPASSSSVMVRRSTIDAVGGFDPKLSQCADWDMWLRLSLEAEFAPIEDPLVRYRQGPSTMSSDPALLERDTFALLDKFFASPAAARYLRHRQRAYGHHWMVCSGSYLHAGQVRKSLRCLRRALVCDPRSVRRPLLLPVRAVSRARGQRSG